MLGMLSSQFPVLKRKMKLLPSFLKAGSVIGLLLCSNLGNAEPRKQDLIQRKLGFQIARELIISEEGFRSKVYDDLTGKTLSRGESYKGSPTIGYGHKLTKKEFEDGEFLGYNIYNGSLPHDVAKMYVSSEEAFLLAVSIVDCDKYNKWQIGAAISLGYNAGPSVLRYVLRGKSRKEIIRRWASIITSKGKVLPGLVKRRNKEIMLFNKRN